MRKLLTLILVFTLTSSAAHANCDGDTCIDVTTDQASNEVVITVKKGRPGSSVTSKPKSTNTPALKKPWIPWLPKPKVNTTPRPVAHTKPRKPRVKTMAASQISNQVKRLLPSGSIITQPLGNPLVQQPVNFMTNTPTQFNTVIIVLEVPITIHLTPSFKWDFGDGNSLTTKLPGAPYPLNLIENTYRSAGEKTVSLTTTWSGYWRAGTITAPIKGVIVQQKQVDILVRPAGTTYRP